MGLISRGYSPRILRSLGMGENQSSPSEPVAYSYQIVSRTHSAGYPSITVAVRPNNDSSGSREGIVSGNRATCRIDLRPDSSTGISLICEHEASLATSNHR